ncbi:hypothetical protein BJF90_03875 [Pseudonocardia sp. CNS-004]|nr:hypothetical protein BJF90_03875 [Pseudonocardia sp. CNS-004]
MSRGAGAGAAAREPGAARRALDGDRLDGWGVGLRGRAEHDDTGEHADDEQHDGRDEERETHARILVGPGGPGMRTG